MNLDNELNHFGVLGMHWGHRKALRAIASSKSGKTIVKGAEIAQMGKDHVHSRLKETGKLLLSSIRHPIITQVANAQSLATGSVGTMLRRQIYQKTSEIHDVNQRIEQKLRDEKRKG